MRSILSLFLLTKTLAQEWYFNSHGAGAPVRCASAVNTLECASYDGSNCLWGTFGDAWTPYEEMTGITFDQTLNPLVNNCPAWRPSDGSDACTELGCYDCETPGTFVWEELMESATGIPEVVVTELEVDSATLSLNIEIEADYLGKTKADVYEYVYGTTYVIDFEDFNAHSDNIREPGTCQNRGDVFSGVEWDSIWDYSSTPNADDAQVGSTDYLAYAPGGDWNLEMSPDDVCKIVYSASFTWDELTACTDYNDDENSEKYISTIEYETNLTLSGTLYINVVSPFSSRGDFGFYRVYQLLSQPFMIVVSKTVYVLGDVGINLLTMDIIAVYKEDEANIFRLIVLTESAEYLRLSRDGLDTGYLQVFTPTDDNTAGITSADFTTLTTAQTEGNCLQNKDYICSQLWQIEATDVKCVTDGAFTDFSGTYYIQFTPECRPEAEMPRDTADEKAELYTYCETWLSDHEDEIVDPNADNKVLLQASLNWKDEICDPQIFEVQFAATMQFFIDEGWVNAVPETGHLYQVGEATVYVKISADYPSTHYDVFDTELLNVWICTFDPLDGPRELGAIGTLTEYSVSTMTSAMDSGYRNSYDNSLTASKSGYFISGTHSVHDNDKEDRQYKFKWSKPEDAGTGTDAAYVSLSNLAATSTDAHWTRTCKDLNDGNAALIGIAGSSHSNEKEDRVWTWQCGLVDSARYTLDGCTWSNGWDNDWDAQINFYCGNDGVIRSIESYHDNDREDRRFKYECCIVTDTQWEIGAEHVGCFSENADDNNGKFLDHIYDPANDGIHEGFALDEVRDGLDSNEIQFKFDVPRKVARDTLYIHAEIEVSLSNGDRRRMIHMESETATKSANQMDHFVDRVGITSQPQDNHYKPVHDEKYPFEEPGPQAPVQQPWVISLESPWVVVIGGLLALVLAVNLVFMCYTNCVAPTQAGRVWFGARQRYEAVKGTDADSEFDSERDAINVVSN